MKAAFIGALSRYPWALLGVAVVLLLALWLVLSRSYALRLEGDGIRFELAPAQPSAPPVRR